MKKAVIGLFASVWSAAALAGEVDVIAVDASKDSEGRYSFGVTLRHADEGWEHYADAWQVVAPDGTVLGTRTLYHPHVDEQPFTRGLSGVQIPGGTTEVIVRAHDKVHGLGGKEFRVKLP
jgi:hypothetical protein